MHVEPFSVGFKGEDRVWGWEWTGARVGLEGEDVRVEEWYAIADIRLAGRSLWDDDTIGGSPPWSNNAGWQTRPEAFAAALAWIQGDRRNRMWWIPDAPEPQERDLMTPATRRCTRDLGGAET